MPPEPGSARQMLNRQLCRVAGSCLLSNPSVADERSHLLTLKASYSWALEANFLGL
jgi:hypothetical protein